MGIDFDCVTRYNTDAKMIQEYAMTDIAVKYSFHRHNADYEAATSDAIRAAISELVHDSTLNQYTPATIVDAIMQVDACDKKESSDIVTTAKKILIENDYCEWKEILTFTCFVLFYYALNEQKTVSEAYRDFVEYDIFTALYSHYKPVHSQTLNRASTFAKNVIHARKGVRQKYGFDNTLNQNPTRYANEMSEIHVNKNMDMTNLFRSTANLISKAYGTTVPTYIACAAVFKSVIEERNVEDVMVELLPDTTSVYNERITESANIFNAFSDKMNQGGLSWKQWMWTATTCGLIPVIESVGADKRVLEAIQSERVRMEQNQHNRNHR